MFFSTTNQPFGAILGMSVCETAFPGVWPMSAVVASALLRTPVLRDAINVLGVRKAGTNSILQMFADGFKVNVKAGYSFCSFHRRHAWLSTLIVRD